MANTNAPFGFRQVAGTGSSPTFEQVEGIIDAATGAMFYGDPVGFQTASADGSFIPIAVLSPVVAVLAGVFKGARWVSVNQKRPVWSNYWPSADIQAATTGTGWVCNDPNAQFLAQTNSTGATLAMVGLNCQFLYGTGNTTNGMSGAVVDVTQAPTQTATWPFRILNLVTQPPGAPGTQAGAFNYVTVAFNNVTTKSLTAHA